MLASRELNLLGTHLPSHGKQKIASRTCKRHIKLHKRLLEKGKRKAFPVFKRPGHFTTTENNTCSFRITKKKK